MLPETEHSFVRMASLMETGSLRKMERPPGKLTPRPVCKMTAGANVQNFLENALHRDEFHVLAPFAELRGTP